METFSPVPGEFSTQRPVTRSFDVFFDLRSNKRLSKHWWCWWFETPSRPLWRHRNDLLCNVNALRQGDPYYASVNLLIFDPSDDLTPSHSRTNGDKALISEPLGTCLRNIWRNYNDFHTIKYIWYVVCEMVAILYQPQCVMYKFITGWAWNWIKQVTNKIWWLCLVLTSTTRIASNMGYRMAKKISRVI